MVRINYRTNNVQIFGLVCGIEEITHCKRGTFPVQKHVSIGKNFLNKISIKTRFKNL